ncbi:MAG: DUF1659 domain-containing protein [Bacillota bacterium]
MATFIPLEDRLQLRVNVGTALEPVYRTRSWGNVKPGVSDAILHDFAEALGDLTVEDVEKIFRVKVGELEDE